MRELQLEQDEKIVFDIFFAGVVSMAHCHPGNGRSNGYATAPPTKTVEECADVALEMIEVRREVMYSREMREKDAWLEMQHKEDV